MRYKPFGVMVSKSWLFERAGRPVIYQPESEFDLLHETQRFRHKEYDPPSVDFTWEREWRIRTDALELDPGAVSLVVPNRGFLTQMCARFREVGRAVGRGCGCARG